MSFIAPWELSIWKKIKTAWQNLILRPLKKHQPWMNQRKKPIIVIWLIFIFSAEPMEKRALIWIA